MNETVDGDYQTYKAESGAFVRENFFGRPAHTKELVQDLTDDQIWNLKRGGHDYRKVYAAYKAATEYKGQPTVILAKTVKGYGLGTHFEGRNATHQMKKLTLADLKAFRDHMHVPITDAQLEEDPYLPPYYHPGIDYPEIQYLMDRRKQPRRLRPRAPLQARRRHPPGREGLRGRQQRLRQAGRRHHHGVRPPAQGPHARQGVRQPHRADHPR